MFGGICPGHNCRVDRVIVDQLDRLMRRTANQRPVYTAECHLQLAQSALTSDALCQRCKSVVAASKTSGQSNLTKGRIAAAPHMDVIPYI